MKIKNNTKNLIPRKQIGGQIPKFQNSGQFRRLSMSKYYQDPKTKKVYEYNNGKYTQITKPITISNAFQTTAYGPNGETARSYRGLLRGANASRTSEQVALSRLPKQSVTPTNNTIKPKATPTYKTTPKGTKYLDYGDGTFSLAGSSKRYRYDDYRDNSATQNPGTQGKPAGTKGSGTKGDTRSSGTRGNARTIAKPTVRTTTTTPAVKSTINVPNGMEYASDYLNASTPGSVSSTYNTLVQNVLSDVDKRIAEIRPTISSRSAYADMEDAMAGWDLKRKQKMMDASVGTAWDWNTEEGRKNFVGMANLMKNGKGNYNKVYNQWIASQPKTTESQNETYAQRFPLAYQSGLLTTPITDNLSLTTQQPTSTNQPSVGWVNTQAIQDAVNRVMPQLSVGNTNNNNFTTLELPQNLSGFVTDLSKRKKTGNWTFAKQGIKLIRRK